MNWQHFRTFLRLRWRLRVNQNKRAGSASVWIQRFFLACGIAAAVVMFVIFLLLGLFVLERQPPAILMLVWDGLVAAFLFVWLIELLVELQRSEILSMDKFLHLPVSLNGAFLINYAGSILSPVAVVALSAMIGLSIGLTVSRGPSMLVLFPLVAAFFVAVTSITYQFRGWLASLMMNKRRRRTIISIATIVFVHIVNLPNLLTRPWRAGGNIAARAEMEKEISRVDQLLAAGRIDKDEHRRQVLSVRGKYRFGGRLAGLQPDEIQQTATMVNTVVPLGWLPYGASTAAEGRVLPSLLGAFGLVLIGGASLARSYRTTLRLYTGQFGSRKPRTTALPAPARPSTASAGLLEKRLPWLSEQASAIALACFRSLTRAPEAKLLLLSPMILVVIGSMFMRNNSDPPELLRPLMAFAGIGMILATLLQLAGNQFGFDRSGFRTYVLAPARRRDILLGKNLALAPLVLGLAAAVVVAVQVIYPMRVDHFLAALTQTVPMYLLFCLLGNFLSMLAPVPVAPGSLKPSKPKGMAILIHLGFLFLFPLALSPTLIPLGIEFLLSWAGWSTWFPAYLVFILLESAAVICVYPLVVDWQGELLQRREQQILEVVTSKIE